MLQLNSNFEKPQSLINRITGWPVQTEGPRVKRINSCSFCGANEGFAVASSDYWDLSTVQYIRCPSCSLTQVDPMLSREVVAKGCEAYYLREQMREGKKNVKKNMIRSFRKGVFLGMLLKRRGIDIKSVLEVGAGDGYFSRGLQFAFPNAKISCLDIVQDVLSNIAKTHKFSTLLGTPEELPVLVPEPAYDLIIARDIIEHVGDPDQVLKAFSKVLLPGGYLHIITPNGFEDIWMAYCHSKIMSLPGEMVINHVNFFTPLGLKVKLEQLKFKPLIWFIYDFNGTRWGRARRISKDQMCPTSTQLSADKVIQQSRQDIAKTFTIEEHEVLGRWWVSAKLPWLTYLYCFLKEKRRFTLPADIGIGHEIFGLLQLQR